VTARIIECTDLEYLNDPCARPSLSKSIATILVGKSCLHAWAAHPRLGGVKKTSTDVQTDGLVLHKLLLGKGAELEVLDIADYRTTRAKDLRDAAYAANKIPVKMADYKEAVEASSRMRDSFVSLGYEFTGHSEVAIEWTERVGDGEKSVEVLCRCKIDHLIVSRDSAVIYDFKKARSAHENDITRVVEDYGMDIQYVAYQRAVRALYPYVTAVPFTFLVAEFEPPYAVNHIEPDSIWEDIGHVRWDLALTKWAECLRLGSWPGYAGEHPTIITPPAWVKRRYLGDDFEMGDVGLES
jgi:hypothetical protein